MTSDQEAIEQLLAPHWGPVEPTPEPVRSNDRNVEFYHGTGRRLSPGDHVLPWKRLKEMGVVEGDSPHGGSHVAWASKSFGEASSYGKNIYKVRPLGEHEVLHDGRVRSEHGYEVLDDWYKS